VKGIHIVEGHCIHAHEHFSGLQGRDRGIVIKDQCPGRFALAHNSPSTLASGDECRLGGIGDTGRGHFPR
jgi:hypothetical protein